MATLDWQWSYGGQAQVRTEVYKNDPGYMHMKCLSCGKEIRRKNRVSKKMNVGVNLMKETDEALKDLIDELEIARVQLKDGQVKEAWNRVRKAKHECERIEEDLLDFMMEEHLKGQPWPVKDNWKETE